MTKKPPSRREGGGFLQTVDGFARNAAGRRICGGPKNYRNESELTNCLSSPWTT